MDPYVRDQLGMIKSRMVKNIELVGKYKIEGKTEKFAGNRQINIVQLSELMDPDAFQTTALKLAALEAKEMHFMGCFEAAENEPTIAAFEERFESLNSRPHEANISENPVVQRCREFCREQFQRKDWEYKLHELLYDTEYHILYRAQ